MVWDVLMCIVHPSYERQSFNKLLNPGHIMYIVDQSSSYVHVSHRGPIRTWLTCCSCCSHHHRVTQVGHITSCHAICPHVDPGMFNPAGRCRCETHRKSPRKLAPSIIYTE